MTHTNHQSALIKAIVACLLTVTGSDAQAGKVSPCKIHGMAANLDLHATFVTLAVGTTTEQPRGYISQDLSGVLLRAEESPGTTWLYGPAFRSGSYKIHLSTKTRSSNPDARKREPAEKHDPPLLFDLSKDLGEQNNIAADHPQIVSRLVQEMNEVRKLNASR
ncbi:MAG: hypothetical protein RIK87_06300 [Fuerstiella sp.]